MPRPERTTSLEGKTLAIVLLTTLGLVAAIALPLRAFVLHRFEALEHELGQRDLDRARNTLSDEVNTLHAMARDYAAWDDTYEFVGGLRPDYPAVNFPDATFLQNRIGLIVITDVNRHVAYAQGYDLSARALRPAPPERVLFPSADDVLYAHLHPERTDISGFVTTPGGPFLVGAHPIVTSARTGTPRGSLVMGRALDATEVARLAHMLRLDLSVSPVAGPFAAPDVEAVLPGLRGESPTLVRPLDLRMLAGYALVRDVRGEPCFVLRVASPRNVYAQGRADAQYMIVSVSIASILFGIIVLLLLHWLVVRRVTSLGREVGVVGARADNSLRVTAHGNDEIAKLGSDVNAMLASLEHLTRQVDVERDKAEKLLLNILPRSIAQRLKMQETIADSFAEVSVLFADIVGFTDLSSRIEASAVLVMLNEIFSGFDALAERHGLEKIKTIGDAYMVVSGLPEHRSDHAEALAAMSLDMLTSIDEFNAAHGTTLSIRVGINTGPVIAGVIGTKKFIYDIWGDAVNIASRMESSGVPGRVQVSETTHDQLIGKFEFESRGAIKVKGKGEMLTWLLVSRIARS